MSEQLWERQRRTFERTAEAYDQYRPTYPDAIFDDLRAYAKLEPDDRILEVGCGTGKATRSLARFGNRLVAIDPSEGMIDVARRNLGDLPHVELRVSRFEDLDDGTFGLVVCSQSFHWLDEATRYERCARSLRAGGALGLLGNAQVNPPDYLAFFERVQDVYLEHAPAMTHEGEFRQDATDNTQLDEMVANGYFVDTDVFRHRWHWTLPRDHYLGLMSTHSPHAALPDDQRQRLLQGIGELIDADFDGHVTEHYVTEMFVARRS